MGKDRRVGMVLGRSRSQSGTLIGVDRGYADFREFVETEVGLPRRGTMTTPAIGQQEAKNRGFLEEALARPGG